MGVYTSWFCCSVFLLVLFDSCYAWIRAILSLNMGMIQVMLKLISVFYEA
jgi:hypothetical protein